MTADVQYKLFFLRGNRSFPDGTLFELKSEEPVLIPDRGDGRAVEVPLNSLIEISPFAENVPPAHCPVTITSINFGVPGDAVIDKTIHYQVIVVPLPSSQNVISGVKVMDRIRNAEADHYEASTAATENGRPIYRLHIGHLRPGFYEAIVEFPDHEPLRLTYIKFFPKQFTDRYAAIEHPQNSALTRAGREFEAPMPIVVSPHRSGEPFSAELLNHALGLVTEWGENFRKPIHERIRVVHPELTDAEIDELTAIASKAEYRIYAIAEDEMAGNITESEIVPRAIREFPWLSTHNASRLANIGMYYARR